MINEEKLQEEKLQTVMVVEDCEADIDALVACLGNDYRVRVATDGASALEDIGAELPDMILLDILMPGIDGFEVCRRIKEDPRTGETLVIFVTSLTETVDETRGLEMGAIDYITKPFNFAVIRAKVKTHLDLARARKELERQNHILKENMRLNELVEQIYRHDLKTPIQVILGAAQMMQVSNLCTNEKCRKFLSAQVGACYTMLDMINRTMLLYKMENGNCPIDVKPVNILPVLDRVIIGLNKKMQDGGIDLRIFANGIPMGPGDRFVISCDEVLFYLMMSNLIRNAMEASPDGECVIIRICGSNTEYDGCVIEIENRGVIPAEIRDRFFQKFVTHGKFSGTGLGTYSARMTAELHGGSINFTVSDEENKTVLSVCLPGSASGAVI